MTNIVKKWKQFLNEDAKFDPMDEHLIDLIEIKKQIDEIIENKNNSFRTKPEFNIYYKAWVSIMERIKEYYKKELEKEFNKNGEEGVRQLHKEIMNSLKRNKTYEEKTGLICFDLTEFTRNLINQL